MRALSVIGAAFRVRRLRCRHLLKCGSGVLRVALVCLLVASALLADLLTAGSAGFSSWPLVAGAPVASAAAESDASGYEAVRPELREEVMEATAGKLSQYDLDVRLDPVAGTIGGRERIAFVNETSEPLREIYLRLFPNAGYYGAGGLTVADVRVDGEPIDEPELSVSETVLRVPLAAALPTGGTAEITLAFTTTVPVDSTGSYGILNVDSATGTWILSDWYPILAGHEPDAGWRLDPPTAFGDPTFGDAALYQVALTLPAGLQIVASGSAVGEAADGGNVTRRYVAGPARDFALVADADYAAISREVDGVTVTSYANPGGEAGATAALEIAASALEVYSTRFGAYPFTELDLVDAALAEALGVAWTGIVFLDGPSLYAGMAAENPDGFAFVIAHEVGHQWWGASVGANSNDHTFMVEGLTTYTALVWAEEARGEETAGRLLARSVAGPYQRSLEERGDQVADLPIRDGQVGRGPIFYGKAALGFLAIRERIGDAAFFAALDAYARDYAYRIAEPEDLRAAFEEASGEDLKALWRFWFEAAETTVEDVDALLEQSAALGAPPPNLPFQDLSRP